ncbi:IgGFc-binding protein-like, partial [Acipenser oxyrinchus oxyrinchus]
VNGVLENLPFVLGDIRVYCKGVYVVIKSSTGIKVTYDLHYQMSVTVPQTYMGQMCGLCGNYNGNRKDEFRLPNGREASDIKTFGEAWKVSIPGVVCSSACDGSTCPVCDKNRQAIFEKPNYCGIINDPKGPLAACYVKISPENYFSNCIYDLCMSNGDTKVLCHSIQSYVTACQAIGVDIKSWRTPSFCPMTCPANSHYDVCPEVCSITCAGITDISKCPAQCAEGCACDDGYFFDGEGCVTMDNCGCFENGRYYQPAEVVITENCKQKCSCSPMGGLVCEDISCPTDTKCEIKNGIRACYNTVVCKEASCKSSEQCKVVDGVKGCHPLSYSTCSAAGDPHYLTFDGKLYNFMGTCIYEFVKLCSKDTGLTPFSVKVQNDNRGSKAVSFTKVVTVDIFGMTVTISKDYPYKILVNGKKVSLPAKLENEISVHISNKLIIIERKSNVRVTYSITQEVTVTVSAHLASQVCGACGNFNGNEGDDMTSSTGKISINVHEVIDSWKAKDHSSW